MAGIKVKGILLDLGGDFVLSLDLISSHFSEDIKSDIAFPSLAPWNDHNKRALGHIDIEHAIGVSEKIDCEFEFTGRFIPGKIVLRNIDDQGLDYNLYFNRGALSFLDIYCHELSLPNLKDLQSFYLDGINEVFPESYVSFPTYFAPSFYEDQETPISDRLNPAFKGYLNLFDEANGTFLENYLDNNVAQNENTLVPQPALMAILKAACNYDGFVPDGDFYQNPMARRLHVFNNLSLDRRVNPTPYESVEAVSSGYNTIVTEERVVIPLKGNTVAWDDDESHYIKNEGGDFTIKVVMDYTASTWGKLQIRVKSSSGLSDFLIAQTPLVYSGQRVEMTVENTFMADGSKVYLAFEPSVLPNREEYYFSVGFIQLNIDKQNAPLIEPGNPEDLAAFFPVVKVLELFKVVQALNVGIDINFTKRRIFFNYKSELFRKDSSFNLDPYLLSGIGVEMESSKEIILQHEHYSSLEQDQLNGIHVEKLHVDNTGRVSLISQIPADFKGDKPEIPIFPFVERSIGSSVYPDKFNSLVTYITGVGSVISTGAQKMDKIRLGIYRGMINNVPESGNSYDDPSGESISLHLSVSPGSLGLRWSSWLRYLNRDPRWFTYKALVPKQVLEKFQADDVISVRGNKCLIDTISTEVSEGAEIELEIRVKIL